MKEDHIALSRRSFAGAAGILGLTGITVAFSPGTACGAEISSENHRLDLSHPEAALAALAKVKGSLPGARRFGIFDGQVIALAANGGMRPILGLRGISVAASTCFSTGGFDITERTFGLYYDLATSRPLRSFINPLNGRQVRAPIASAERSTRILPGQLSGFAWRVDHGRASLEEGPYTLIEREHGPDRSTSTIQSTQTSTHHAAIDDLADGRAAIAASHGDGLRTGPWPAWLAMSDAAGAGLYRYRFHGGFSNLPAETGPTLTELQSHDFWPATLWGETVA